MHYPEKLPDKIYIPIVDDDKGGHPEVYWEDFPYPNVKDNAEFIRKSALLEWAKEQWLHARNGTLADQIRSSAYEEMMKHIESL